MIRSAWFYISIERHGDKMRKLGKEPQASTAFDYACGDFVVRKDLEADIAYYIKHAEFDIPPIPAHCLTPQALDYLERVIRYCDNDDTINYGASVIADEISYYLGKWADNEITESVSDELDNDYAAVIAKMLEAKQLTV